MEAVMKDALKANEDALNLLHSLVAQDLIKKIKDGDASPADISAAIRFLKDNEISADISTNRGLKQLEGTVTAIADLPFMEEEESCTQKNT